MTNRNREQKPDHFGPPKKLRLNPSQPTARLIEAL